MKQPGSFVESSRMGVLVLSGFALVWVAGAIGLSSLSPSIAVSAAVIILTSAITINLVAARRHFPPTDEEKSSIPAHRRRTVFIVTNVAQAVLFSALISICIAFNELPYILLIGSLIVGSHLIPIGLSFGELNFIVGGAGLILTGVVGTLLSWTSLTTPDFATAVVGLTNAVVLTVLAGMQVYLYSGKKQNHTTDNTTLSG